jgi:trk system potassium uptake protein TrkA
MKLYVIVGLGKFGQCVLRSLVARKVDVMVIDKDADRIQAVRDLATEAVKADALNQTILEEVLPDGVYCAFVDLGHQVHSTILVTHQLAKLKIPNVVVEADSPEEAEILKIVGATRIVFPEEEAAERVVGVIAGPGSLDFYAVSEDFSLVEVVLPPAWEGQTLLQLDLRRTRKLTVVAARKRVDADGKDWRFPEPDTAFVADDVLLVAGSRKAIESLTTA